MFKDTRKVTEKIENQDGIKEKDGVLTYVGEVVNKDSEQ